MTIHSPGLEQNLLGDPADQAATIYLPAAYRTEPERRFATLYFLHGFADTRSTHAKATPFARIMDKLIDRHAIEPMIVVVPNGVNRLFGSFWANSEATGNWADFVDRDLVGYVDGHYRTLASPDARGLVGHSMGGFGALMIAFEHPDVFSSVYALSPCCTVLEGDFGPSNPAWGRTGELESPDEVAGALARGDFSLVADIAIEAALAPGPDRPLFGDSPFRLEGTHVAPDPAVYPVFQAKLPATAIPSLLTSIYELKGIFIDYGAEDDLSHVPLGAQKVSQELALAGVPHTLMIYEGNHVDRIDERLETRALPWFSKQLRH